MNRDYLLHRCVEYFCLVAFFSFLRSASSWKVFRISYRPRLSKISRLQASYQLSAKLKGRQTKHDPTIDQVSNLYLLRLRAFFTFSRGSARGRERRAPSATPVVFLTRRTKKKNRVLVVCYYILLITTAAAPALYVVGQKYSCSLSSSLKYIVSIHNEDFHTYFIQQVRKNRKSKVPRTNSVRLTQL